MMSNVWFTSDLHIGHQLVADQRAQWFGAPTEPDIWQQWHDRTLADNWDARVSKKDQVWVLGDISSGTTEAQAYALNWLSDRPGEKHLVPGNHDRCHPMYRDSHVWLPAYLQVFKSVQVFARRRIAGVSVLLSHFPYDGDHTQVSRFDQYRMRDYGEPLLHGHTHRPWRATASTPIYPVESEWATIPPNQFHVGVDAWNLTPVHTDELADLMREVTA
ncbi:phosphoesterase [Mycobacterium phage Hilltopfarm]|nr:phosphoesterase [Mycobacterium phage Hilltopfarm]